MSLIHWWPLNGDTKNYGTSGEQVTESGVTYTNGKIGQSMYKGKLNFTAEQWKKTIGNTISIAMWIYTRDDGTYSAGTPFFGNGGMTKPNNRKFTMFHYPAKTTLHCSWQNDDLDSADNPNTYLSITYANFFEIGKWIHLCVVQDAATETVTIYRNGTQYSETKVSGLATMNFKSAAAAPIRNNIDYQHINDLRIYDHALSQAEVKELSKALVMHYSFDDTLAEPTTNVSTINGWSSYTSYFVISERTETGLKVYRPTNSTNTVLALSNSAVTGKMAAGEIWTFSCYLYVDGKPYKCTQSDMSTYKYSGINYYSNDDGYYTCTFTVGTPEAWIIHAPMFGSVGTNVMCEIDKIQFEKKDHATPYTPASRGSMLVNEAGYRNPSSVTNFKLSTISNNGSYSGYFDGQTSCIDTPVIKPNMFTEDYTLSFWVYPLDSGRAVYFGDHQLSSIPTTNFERNANGTLRYYHNGSPDKSFANTDTPPNAWTMLTVTYTPGTMKVYKNGVLAETFSHTATITKNINGIMRIGRDNRTGSDYGATPLYGYISDFRFYVTCLSAGDVQELYKTKAYITDKSDIMCGEFIENKTEAGVTEKSIFECNETQEKLNIPGFELLDGILIEKNPYFDTGLVFGDVNTSIYVDAEVTPTNTSGNNCLAGSGNSSWNGPIMLNFCGGKMEFGTSGYSTSTEPQGKFAANERLTVQAEIYPTTQKWYKNNVQIKNITQRERKTTNATFAIGTFKIPSGTVGATNSFKGYIHRFYVKYGDEVRCYLPAKRKSDNVYGLYDIHTKTFLVNSGGGTVSGTTSTLCDKAAIYQSGCISGREIIEL
jgi:hypothetical protein